jgi:hypothetical protein
MQRREGQTGVTAGLPVRLTDGLFGQARRADQVVGAGTSYSVAVIPADAPIRSDGNPGGTSNRATPVVSGWQED